MILVCFVPSDFQLILAHAYHFSLGPCGTCTLLPSVTCVSCKLEHITCHLLSLLCSDALGCLLCIVPYLRISTMLWHKRGKKCRCLSRSDVRREILLFCRATVPDALSMDSLLFFLIFYTILTILKKTFLCWKQNNSTVLIVGKEVC